MSYGWLYRSFETSVSATEGTTGDVLLAGPETGFIGIVQEAKAATGAGTGPWPLEIVIENVGQGGSDFEVWKTNVEEGTGPGGEDKVKRNGTLYKSSNSGSPVNWGSGVKNVFAAPLASKAAAFFDKLTTVGVVKRLGEESYSILATGATGEALLDDTTAGGARTTISACDRALSEQTLLTTRGDLLTMAAGPVEARLPIGAVAGSFLRSDGSDPAWAVPLASEVAVSSAVAPLSGSTVEAVLDSVGTLLSARSFTKKTSDEADAASETVVSELSNITIPGTPDGSKKYRAMGQLLVDNGTSGNQNPMARVRVGTNGDVTDAILWEGGAFYAGNTANMIIPIVIPEFTPAANTKLSVTFWEGDATIRGDATVLESYIEIQRIS